MAMTLITTNSGTVSTSDFTSGIDSTYKLYIFKYYDVNPVTDAADFSFQANAVGASGYNEIMHTTYFSAWRNEADTTSGLTYDSGVDQTLGTAFQQIAYNVGNGADESCAGTLWLFNPSNTTYQKHFYSVNNNYYNTNYTFQNFVAGYFNITAAIDDIQFKMSTGDMDAVIKMYGVG